MFSLGSANPNDPLPANAAAATIHYISSANHYIVRYPEGTLPVVNDKHVVSTLEVAIEMAESFFGPYVILGDLPSVTASGGTAEIQYVSNSQQYVVYYANGLQAYFADLESAIESAMIEDGNYVIMEDADRTRRPGETSVIDEVVGDLTLPVPGLAELDAYLMQQSELPKDLTLQLSKSGSNTIGGPKLSLELGVGISDRIFMSETSKKEARARYGSYPQDMRINALSEIEADILVLYLTSSALEDLLSSQRSLRRAFKKQKSDSTMRSPGSFLLDVRGKPTPEKPIFDVPLVAIEVVFQDQNGEIRDMEYEIKCRGTLNFVEAFNMTRGGLDTSRMSLTRTFTQSGVQGTGQAPPNVVKGSMIKNFPTSYAKGSLKPESYYHLLWQWGSKNRGTVDIEINLPTMIPGTKWSHERIFTYDRVMNKNMDTEFVGQVKAKSQQPLFRDNFTVDGMSPEVIQIKIPIYVEPLPNHLVMTPNGVRSKWEMTGDVNSLADHQKVELNLRLARPRSSEMWEQADFNGDFVISYDEYISPEGVAARRAGRAGASPVPNTELVFTPDATNSWLSAKKTYRAYSNISGYLNITLPPGRWTISRVSSEKMVRVNPEDQGAKTFDELSLYEQSKVTEEYGDNATQFSYAANRIPMAKISVPAAFYWRETDEYDTTPTGVVGAKVLQDMTGTNQDVLSSFELRDSIPPLKSGQPATTDTIYQKLVGMHPNMDKTGYPVSGQTQTSRQVFDTAVMFFKEDSPYDLSQIGMYEKQLESDFDTTVQGYKNIKIPSVNETIDYNGYKIRRVIVDTSFVTDELKSGIFSPSMDGKWGVGADFNVCTYFPPSVAQLAGKGEYVQDSPGEEEVYNINLPLLSQHRSDGNSFEALVYYLEHQPTSPQFISLYGIKHGTRFQDRVDELAKIYPIVQERVGVLNEVHMYSTPSSAIVAGQFILLQPPKNHRGWNDIHEMLENQTEAQAMFEAVRAIDTGGKPKFPPGETNTEVHAYFAQEEGGPRLFGTDYPGSMVFFESDIFPGTFHLPPVPKDYVPPGQSTEQAPMMGASLYNPNAQANIEFIQDISANVAPQPNYGDEDEYNMGFGVL